METYLIYALGFLTGAICFASSEKIIEQFKKK